MNARNLTVLCIVVWVLPACLFAQAAFNVGSSPVTVVVRSGQTEQTGAITFTQASGTSVAGTITITYRVPITVDFATRVTVTGTGDYDMAPKPSVNTALSSNSAGSLVINVPAGKGSGWFHVRGVRVAVAGTGLTDLSASIWAAGNAISAGQTMVSVINYIAPGISSVTTSTSTGARTVINIDGATGAVTNSPVELKVTEGFLTAFGVTPSTEPSQTISTMVRITLSSAPPAGVKVTFPNKASTVGTAGSGGVTDAFQIADCATGATSTSDATFTSSSTTQSVCYRVVVDTDMRLPERLVIPVTADTTGATLPIPAGVISVNATFAPIGNAFGPDGAALGSPIPRYASLETGPVALIVITTQALTALHSFTGQDGATPHAGLILASDGSFYGTTSEGGTSGYGTVFKVDPAGTLTTLHSFTGTDGTRPYAGLIQASDGSFYGTTSYGGVSWDGTPYSGYGTVFKMDTAGVLTTLHDFTGGSDGGQPNAGLIQASDGSFYGTTVGGGASGDGTVFKIDPAGTLTTLHSFASSDGASPYAGLIQARDGSLYGTTIYGGAFGLGTVFKIDPAGTLTTVHSFTRSDGSGPYAGLTQASDGSFYGTMSEGGTSGYGTVFKMDSAGTLTTLHSFTGGSDGANPGLIQASDGSFYGTTVGGGATGAGTIFEIDAAGMLTTLHTFAFGDGAFPPGGLIQASDRSLYGTTSGGGTAYVGVVFRLHTPPTAGPVTPSNTQFGGFVDSPFDLTASFTDSDSALTGCEYTTNGGSSWNAATLSGGSPTFTCTKTGIIGTSGQILTLNMRATGSGGTGRGATVTRTVDAAAPITTRNAPADWVATNRTVTLTPRDGSGSGVKSTQYCTDAANSCTPSTNGISVPVACNANTACQTYVRYRSIDNVGNVEAIESAPVKIDKAAPAAVGSLTAPASTKTSVSLTWSNPPDSGSGNASFDVRYRVGSTFTEADWAGASQAAGEPRPPKTGMTIGGLICGTTHAFAIKTTDNVGNTSPISNAVSSATVGCLTIVTASLPEGEVGKRYLAGLHVVDGIPPYSFRVVGGSLPPGLTLRANTGTIMGAPTAAGTFSFRVEVTSSDGSSDQKDLGIVIK